MQVNETGGTGDKSQWGPQGALIRIRPDISRPLSHGSTDQYRLEFQMREICLQKLFHFLNITVDGDIFNSVEPQDV